MSNHKPTTRSLAGIASAVFLFLCSPLCIAQLAQFPDAHNKPPAGWTGPVFKLSQNYPAVLPALEPASALRWMQFDFKNPAQASPYLQAVLDYCLEGNKENTFADVSQNP